jgi:hypothetical protein
MARSMQSKEREHAGIPEPDSTPSLLPYLILNVKTPAGRAKEGAGSAVYTRKLNFLPKRCIKNIQKRPTGNGLFIPQFRHSGFGLSHFILERPFF